MRVDVLSDQDWQLLIAQQKESALTIKRFCQSKGVTTGQFHYYQKKFRSQNQVNTSDFLQANIIEKYPTKTTHLQPAGDMTLEYRDVKLTLNNVSVEYVLNLLKGLAS